MRERSRRFRTVAAAVSASLAVIAFAALGGAGLAQSAIGLAQYQYGHGAQYQYGKKVVICHKQKNTISVSVNAWPAHLRHGDTQGACAEQAATATTKKVKEPKQGQTESSTSKQKKPKKGTDTSSSTTKGAKAPKQDKGTKQKGAQQKSVAPTVSADTSAGSPKPKKQKKNKQKGGPPSSSATSAPGHSGQSQGNGGAKGNGGGNGKGNGKK